MPTGSNAPYGKVYLVGAGPGDPGLITVKGLRYLSSADVVVYDRLASDALLAAARPGAELIDAGKGHGTAVLSQDEVNELLVAKAREGKVVVRLKGGDPFVFGRGGEEAERLAEAGIAFEVVPGVTSAIAVPAYAGIPLTHRHYASSFLVATGHEDPAKSASRIDWNSLAKGPDTLVFLMGMAHLSDILHQLVAHGRTATTPAAVIQWGTTPRQRTIIGTLSDIGERAESAGVTAPAVLIVGDVVTLRAKLGWYERQPLFGKRILVTRSRAQASTLVEQLAALGAEPLEFPAIRIEPMEDDQAVDVALSQLQRYDWVVFTSANGVDFVFRRLKALGRDSRAFREVQIAAVGPATAATLETHGIVADSVPGTFTTERLAGALLEQGVAGKRVLLLRAREAGSELTEKLTQAGALVEEVPVYRTVAAREQVNGLREGLRRGEINIITFTSSSTVRHLVAALGEEGKALLQGTMVACIGPVTADTAKQLGLPVAVVAREHTIKGLVAAIVEAVESGGHGHGDD